MATYHYAPSSPIADKLAANRAGHLTRDQRMPITIAAIVTGVGFVVSLVFTVVVIWGFAQTLAITGLIGVGTICFTGAGFLFLVAVMWVNAQMFVPEAINRSPVKWERAKLKVKKASRHRPEMPFSYIIGSYSFAPFVAPGEVPLEEGRDYIVYYTPRSRLLLSIAPADQPESANWLPEN